jgi:hypothetical protein
LIIPFVYVIVHQRLVQESLEEEGYDEEEIEKKVDELRLELEAASAEVVVEDASFTAQETHQIAMRKEKKMEIFRVSFSFCRERAMLLLGIGGERCKACVCRYHDRRIYHELLPAALWCF